LKELTLILLGVTENDRMREIGSCEGCSILKTDSKALFSFKNDCSLIYSYLKTYFILIISGKNNMQFQLNDLNIFRIISEVVTRMSINLSYIPLYS